MVSCQVCNVSFKNVKSLICHLKLVHKKLAILKCTVVNCHRNFSCSNSLRKHLISHDKIDSESSIQNSPNFSVKPLFEVSDIQAHSQHNSNSNTSNTFSEILKKNL